jgi:hypothetical protein
VPMDTAAAQLVPHVAAFMNDTRCTSAGQSEDAQRVCTDITQWLSPRGSQIDELSIPSANDIWQVCTGALGAGEVACGTTAAPQPAVPSSSTADTSR